MSSVNKVILVGRIGKDPEVRAFANGDSITNASVATSEKWRDKATGEQKEHTEWHSIVFSGKLADIAGQYLKKGSLVYIEGSLRTRKWQDKSGQDRYTTEVRAISMQMLGGKSDAASPERGQGAFGSANTGYSSPRKATQEAKKPAAGNGFSDMDDDIPF